MSLDKYFTKTTKVSSSRKRRLERDEDTEEVEPPSKKIKLSNNNDENDEIASTPITDLKYSNAHLNMEAGWKNMLKNEFKKPYFSTLIKNLKGAESDPKIEIFPPKHQVYRAFELCPWEKLKVVIVGQDPYHDNGQAEGLCFSVPKGIKIPSSLKNMYKEAKNDLGECFKTPKHGNLVSWAEQGILLLNTALTVEAHKANSHKKFGWLEFTDNVIKTISNKKKDGVVFILWGKQAQKKELIINTNLHKIVKSAHPSGLSASRGFYGSKPYSKTNDLLKKLGKDEIDWTIDN